MSSVSKIKKYLRNIDGAISDKLPEEMRKPGEIESILYEASDVKNSKIEIIENDSYETDSSSNEFSDGPYIHFEISSEYENADSAKILSFEEKEGIRSSVMASGVEAFAYYVPFHQNYYQWGIYLDLKGIVFTSLLMNDLNVSFSRKLELASYFLLRHELFHFAIEYMAAQVELICGEKCYLDANKKLKDRNAGYHLYEEALANAYALRGFQFPNQIYREPGTTQIFKNLIKSMPPGYCDGWKYTSKNTFLENCNNIASLFEISIERKYKTPKSLFNFNNLYPSLPMIDWRHCPVFLTDQSGKFAKIFKNTQFINRIDMLVETEKFEKKLNKLEDKVIQNWIKTKKKLSLSVLQNGLDFKPFKIFGSNIFSVRVNDNFRAHLEFNKLRQAWYAIDIGNHSEMGHG
jgi:hypothetical protein